MNAVLFVSHVNQVLVNERFVLWCTNGSF